MSAYCDFAPGHPLHGPYHDTEYGFPIACDRLLFERLTLEVFQAGLSWELMLKKRAGFREAFVDYDLGRIAAFGDEDVERLMLNPEIVRNRLKIKATIYNATQVLDIQKAHGSFVQWLASQECADLASWVKHMRKTFKFMGPEVVGEFLMSISLLPGAHRPDCPIHQHLKSQGHV
jgi:DNA-3-methyladenine glycosylase I